MRADLKLQQIMIVIFELPEYTHEREDFAKFAA